MMGILKYTGLVALSGLFCELAWKWAGKEPEWCKMRERVSSAWTGGGDVL